MEKRKKGPVDNSTHYYQAIQMWCDGKSWAVIAKELKRPYSTVYAWRQDPIFQELMAKVQIQVIEETSARVGLSLQTSTATLSNICVDKETKIETKDRIEAAKQLADIALRIAEAKTLLEQNRKQGEEIAEIKELLAQRTLNE